MSYQWGPQGPAFEFQHTYRTESRFLTLRAGVLLLSALVIYWFALAEPEVEQLLLKVNRGNAVPHVLLATLLLLLGGFDLASVARRWRVTLSPGQPASLTSELDRRAKGGGAGVAWLLDVIRTGHVPAPELTGPYRGLLQSLVAQGAAGPRCVQDYLGVRLAHLSWGVGLALALALTWALVKQPPTLALAALWYSGVTTALVARSAWISKSPPSPLALVVAGGLSALIGLLLGWFAGGLPAIGRLAPLGLPLAAAVLLACLVLIEGLAFIAARVPADTLPRDGMQSGLAEAEVAADPERVMHEVERELHRYWTEGIANRRHVWQLSLADPKPEADGTEGGFSAQVLEESQPLAPSDQREPLPSLADTRKRWLLVLSVLGLLMTLAGCVAWAQLTYRQMADAATPWTLAAISMVLMVAGGYALRIGHLLWGRLEVDSVLISLDAHSAAAGLPVQLRWRVVRARSVFYADAPHVVGNRTLLQLTGDEPSARRSVQQVRAYAERATRGSVERAPMMAAPSARPAAAAGLGPLSRPAGRYCSGCGTPVLQGARYCQNCGAALQP